LRSSSTVFGPVGPASQLGLAVAIIPPYLTAT
jgi:hypothetical protein